MTKILMLWAVVTAIVTVVWVHLALYFQLPLAWGVVGGLMSGVGAHLPFTSLYLQWLEED